ncbi:MAG: GNAT family N-acetyltransferase [Chloroflexi bacterium]|nr:GNAT family N-acetyltransferase [Chloroflexota bacterium]
MQIVQPVDEDMWWDVARKCEYATFFHTPLWHKLATQTFPEYKDVTVGIIFNNGTHAILPLLEMKKFKGLGRVVLSSFASCYGDLIADDPITIADRSSVYQYITASRYIGIQIAGNPIYCQPGLGGKLVGKEDFTTILSLDSSFDTLFSNFSKGHKSSFKKGVRMNVSVRQAHSLDDYYDYYGAYQDSLKRWGEKATSQYPWALFEKGFYLAQKYPENIKLWLAIVEERVIAGAWVFYWNQHVDWWHGAAYADYFDHYPNNVLQTKVIKDALEKGYKYYDFNPSGGHENVARFKSRFGAQKWPVPRWEYEHQGMYWGRKIKGKLYRGR